MVEAAGVGPSMPWRRRGRVAPQPRGPTSRSAPPSSTPTPANAGECETSSNRDGGMAAKPHQSCRPQSTSRPGRAPTIQTVFPPPASEPGPAGEAGGTPT
jgi:hypothetical protein